MKKSDPRLLSSCSPARAIPALALAAVLLGPTAPWLAAQSDNFNDGNDTSPVSWYHYTLPAIWGATYSFPTDDTGGKAYRISAPATTPDPYNLMNSRAAAFPLTPTYTNRFTVGADLLAWSTGARPAVGVMWYVHDAGLGTTDGYAVTYSPYYRNIYISIVMNEGQAAYISRLADGDLTLSSSDRIRMVASSHDGVTFLTTVYNLLEPNTPWASVIGQDYTWQGYGGSSGFLLMNQDYPSAEGVSATFDNYVATQPAEGTMPATVTDVYPPPAGKSKGDSFYITNSVAIMDRDTYVDASSIVLCLDGVWIANANLTMDPQVYKQYNPGSFQKSFGGATVTYGIPGVLPWGSKHTNVVAFSDSVKWYTNTWTWTVNYPYLSASNSLPIGSLNVRGFEVRMAQTTNGGANLANSLARAQQQLDGLIPVDQRATSIVQVLNWNKTSEYPNNVPGLCAGTTAAPINIAVESCAYLQLTAGLHRFHINTDDRAGVYSGANLSSTSAVWETPNDTADTTFDVMVEADGLYPIRCLWEETAGGAKLALYSVDLNDSSEVLVNDPSDAAGVVKAWYPVVCKSSSTMKGTYTLATGVSNVLNKTDILGSGCGTVAGQNVTGGTITIPMSGAAQFYRLDTPRNSAITKISKSGSNVVIEYQLK